MVKSSTAADPAEDEPRQRSGAELRTDIPHLDAEVGQIVLRRFRADAVEGDPPAAGPPGGAAHRETAARELERIDGHVDVGVAREADQPAGRPSQVIAEEAAVTSPPQAMPPPWNTLSPFGMLVMSGRNPWGASRNESIAQLKIFSALSGSYGNDRRRLGGLFLLEHLLPGLLSGGVRDAREQRENDDEGQTTHLQSFSASSSARAAWSSCCFGLADLWVPHVEPLHRGVDDGAHGEPGEPFIVGGHHIPRAPASCWSARASPVGLHVVAPEGALIRVVDGELPVLLLLFDRARHEPPLLFRLARRCRKNLIMTVAVVDEVPLEVVDFP